MSLVFHFERLLYGHVEVKSNIISMFNYARAIFVASLDWTEIKDDAILILICFYNVTSSFAISVTSTKKNLKFCYMAKLIVLKH